MMDKYKKMLEDARKDLDVLRKEQTELLEQREFVNDELENKNNQIKKLEETIVSIARLCNIEPPLGLARRLLDPHSRFTLTNTVRDVIKSASSPLTAIEVRDALVAGGFDASTYSNLLASIHTTLKRLAQADELLPVDVDGKTAYKINPEYKPKILQRMSTNSPGLASLGGDSDLLPRLKRTKH